MSTHYTLNFEHVQNAFFYVLLGCPTYNFRPLLWGRPHSSNDSHCALCHVQPEGHRVLFPNEF